MKKNIIFGLFMFPMFVYANNLVGEWSYDEVRTKLYNSVFYHIDYIFNSPADCYLYERKIFTKQTIKVITGPGYCVANEKIYSMKNNFFEDPYEITYLNNHSVMLKVYEKFGAAIYLLSFESRDQFWLQLMFSPNGNNSITRYYFKRK